MFLPLLWYCDDAKVFVQFIVMAVVLMTMPELHGYDSDFYASGRCSGPSLTASWLPNRGRLRKGRDRIIPIGPFFSKEKSD